MCLDCIGGGFQVSRGALAPRGLHADRFSRLLALRPPPEHFLAVLQQRVGVTFQLPRLRTQVGRSLGQSVAVHRWFSLSPQAS